MATTPAYGRSERPQTPQHGYLTGRSPRRPRCPPRWPGRGATRFRRRRSQGQGGLRKPNGGHSRQGVRLFGPIPMGKARLLLRRSRVYAARRSRGNRTYSAARPSQRIVKYPHREKIISLRRRNGIPVLVRTVEMVQDQFPGAGMLQQPPPVPAQLLARDEVRRRRPPVLRHSRQHVVRLAVDVLPPLHRDRDRGPVVRLLKCRLVRRPLTGRAETLVIVSSLVFGGPRVAHRQGQVIAGLVLRRRLGKLGRSRRSGRPRWLRSGDACTCAWDVLSCVDRGAAGFEAPPGVQENRSK